MKDKIIGRYVERNILEDIRKSQEAEFLVIYGRRRVGKTFLIHEFFKDESIYFEVTGQKNGTLKEQLTNFTMAFRDTFLNGYPITVPTTWNEALDLLIKAIEKKITNHPSLITQNNILG